MSWKKIKTESLIFTGKLFVKLPLSWIVAVGRGLGYLTYLIPNKRKKIALKNIQLCFPEITHQEQKKLLKINLMSTGQGLTETLLAYWGSDHKCLKHYEFEGLENIKDALHQGKGCLLLSFHHHQLELACRVINLQLKTKAHMLVRQHNNKLFESHVDAARRSYSEKTIDKKDMRSVLKSLKGNHPVFYVPDQNFSYQFEYINFFNQPAATVIAPSRIAQSTGTPVVPWLAYRKDNRHWVIKIEKPLDFFNSNDTKESLTLMNQWMEERIKQQPEQYLWVHRRFKNHPKGKNFLYKNI